MLDLDIVGTRGARVAVRAAGTIVRYDDLATLADERARQHRDAGIAEEDRVLLRCRSTLDTVINALALLRRSCAVLPVAADAREDSLHAVGETFAPHWRIEEDTVVRNNDVAATPEFPERFVQALLSSGSSGHPKIVLRSAEQVEAGVRIFVRGLEITAADRVLALVPLEHSFGFNSVMLGTLSIGGEIVIPESRHPRGIVKEVDRNEVTVFPAPPIFFDWMHRFAEERTNFLRGVRLCVSVGDILPRAAYTAFVEAFGVPLWQSYGASECGPALLNRSGAWCGDTMALGEPYPEVDVSLRTDTGSAPAEGETGEIVVRSPAVAIGYLGPQDGGSRIVGREFLSGDLARCRDGALQFAGRKKLLITRGGRKVDPGEIEQLLRRHPAVADAAVRTIPGVGEDPLQALVVTRRAVPTEELIEFCASSLAPHKVPRIIELRSSLPRDAAGKLRRDRLDET